MFVMFVKLTNCIPRYNLIIYHEIVFQKIISHTLQQVRVVEQTKDLVSAKMIKGLSFDTPNSFIAAALVEPRSETTTFNENVAFVIFSITMSRSIASEVAFIELWETTYAIGHFHEYFRPLIIKTRAWVATLSDLPRGPRSSKPSTTSISSYTLKLS